MEVCCFYKLFSFLSGNLHFPSFNPQSFEILPRCPNMGLFHSIWSFLCHLNLGKFSTVFWTISFPSLSLILFCVTPDTHCWIWFHILSILIFSISYIWEFTLTWFSRLVVSTLFYHLVHCLIFFFLIVLFFGTFSSWVAPFSPSLVACSFMSAVASHMFLRMLINIKF